MSVVRFAAHHALDLDDQVVQGGLCASFNWVGFAGDVVAGFCRVSREHRSDPHSAGPRGDFHHHPLPTRAKRRVSSFQARYSGATKARSAGFWSSFFFSGFGLTKSRGRRRMRGASPGHSRRSADGRSRSARETCSRCTDSPIQTAPGMARSRSFRLAPRTPR